METFSALLSICAGNSPVPGEFPAQRPVTRSFDVFFDLRLNKLLSKQSWGWWFETLSRPLWRHCNAVCDNNTQTLLSIPTTCLQKDPLSIPMIILGMDSANECRRYIVTSSLIGWAHIQNDPYTWQICFRLIYIYSWLFTRFSRCWPWKVLTVQSMHHVDFFLARMAKTSWDISIYPSRTV